MELLDFFEKNPENFDIYVSKLNNTVNNLETKSKTHPDTTSKKTVIYSIISFTFGFFISKYITR